MTENGIEADRRRLAAATGPGGAVIVPARLSGWVRDLVLERLAEIRRAGRGGNLAADVLDLIDSLGRASDNGSEQPHLEKLESSQILSVGDAAEILECEPRTVRLALQEGRIPGSRIGARNWIIRKQDLDAYRFGRSNRPAEPDTPERT